MALKKVNLLVRFYLMCVLFFFFFGQMHLKFWDDAVGHGHSCLNVSVVMTQTQCSICYLAYVFRTRSFVRVRFVTLWSIWQSIKPENEVSSILMNFYIFSHVTIESQAAPSHRWSWQDVFMFRPDCSIYTTSCITVTLCPNRRSRIVQVD